MEAARRYWETHCIFDSAAKMTDCRFDGIYYGDKHHEPDGDKAIERARMFGVKKFIFSSGCLQDAQKSLELSKTSDDFFVTVGIHPTRALEPYRNFLPSKCNDAV